MLPLGCPFPGAGSAQALRPQQFLYFLPLPQGQGSFRPILVTFRGCFLGVVPSPPTFSTVALATRSRLTSSSLRRRTEKRRRTVSAWMAAIIASNMARDSCL